MGKGKDIIQYWKEKIKQYYKPLKTDGIATKIILTYIPEDKLITMWDIYCTLNFMLSELPVYPFPVGRLNAIKSELDKIIFLNFQDKREILDFIADKIEKAMKRMPTIAKQYRKEGGLKRNDFTYRFFFPETLISEAKNRENIPLVCLYYFFHYSLPEAIYPQELQDRIKQIEERQGFSFDPFEKVSFVNLNIGIGKMFTNKRENKKWFLVSCFIYEQLGIEKDKEEILKTLKRFKWGYYLSALYNYIYDAFPHGQFPFKKLPRPSGLYIFDEKGKYIGTRFIFFK